MIKEPVYAEQSFSSEPYLCKFPWDCFVQSGDNGIVFKNLSMEEGLSNPIKALNVIVEQKKTEVYRTAFFEAFPRNPNTFIRGEGKTIEEAEEKAWEKFQQYSKCANHEFEARGYENGGGFCIHCSMFGSKVILPTSNCITCDTPTWDYKVKDGTFYCKEHFDLLPDEKLTDSQILCRQWIKELDDKN